MNYTRLETVKQLNWEFSNIENLYKSNCVNWKGKTKDTYELFTEIISNEIIQKKHLFEELSTVTRLASYQTDNHSKFKIDNNSNRDEEKFAKRITGLKLDGLGLIKDYQVPIKNSREDKGLGKIDLISFNEESLTLYLIELKNEGNKETLLRASLESYTYFKIIDKDKLIIDFFNARNIQVNKINVKSAVLVTPKCTAHKELIEVNLGERPKFKALANFLDIDFFSVEISTNKFIF
ncbi:hypothetical protein ULMS_19280 [Patiriisocius marinistellae]|uniref:Uncharacterized protein n=1 Tax=Patiriisocius marinistellae TaxID=2494560 RepID=A0A5J4FWA4_9FLAO|nr:hypothetical protein [Patiriisocius marinistellae]GEQ86420.1 hypothetical protein ULMS_19280 [Patiriisocius marinistellae]